MKIKVLILSTFLYLGLIFNSHLQSTYAQSHIITNCPSLQEPNPHIYVLTTTYGTGDVVDVPFDDYIIGVVEGEMFPTAGDPEDIDGYSTWNDEALKAQAVLARTFALDSCGEPYTYQGIPVLGIPDSWQAYRPKQKANYERIRSFVQQGLYLSYSGNYNAPIDAQFRAYNHNLTTFMTADWNSSGPLKGVFDAVSAVDGHNNDGSGAGPGLGQNSADHWARGLSHGVRFPQWDYTKILAHYYTNVQLVAPGEIGYWGPYRWNLLKLEPSSNAEIYYVGKAKSLTLRLQNTGSNTWETGTTLRYRWRRQSSTGLYVTGWSSIGAIAPRNPGEDLLLSPFNVIPPNDVYVNASCCSYALEWDLFRPGGTPFKDQGWLTQEWAIKLRYPVTPPTAPPPCSKTPCPMNASPFVTQWNSVNHPDTIEYQWQRTHPQGTIRGVTPQTSAAIPLERGTNDLMIQSRQVNEPDNTSTWTTIGSVLYDPDPPTIADFTPASQWSNVTSINLSWSAVDPSIGGATPSGIADYTLEQQIGTGAWTPLVVNTQATSYQVTNLLNNNDYTFRLTVRDKAGNLQTDTRTVKIDRDPPSSLLTTPTGPFTKTWTMLRWTSSFNRAPITAFAIDRLVNGTWQTLYPVIDPTSAFLLFEGTPNTIYALRIRAVDAAGNQQPTSPNAHITFTTGTDSSGLFKFYLPILLKDGTMTNLQTVNTTTNTTTNTYPLPGQ